MAIRHAHLERGLVPPTTDAALRRTLRQLQFGPAVRRRGTSAAEQPASTVTLVRPAKPITRDLLTQLVAAMQRSALDRRDRALLLLGFFAALNSSQLVALDVCDVSFRGDVMMVRVGKNKREVVIAASGGPVCAATAVRQWIQTGALHVDGGALFRRCDRGGDPTQHRLDAAYVSVVLKERLKAVGVEPERYSAHSLRRGRLLEIARGIR
jgi:integrase